jgi:uncharacterized Zn-binding protein involved in type VI secretion
MLALLALVIIASQRHAIPAPQGALWPPFPDLERTTQPYDPPVMAGQWFYALTSAGFYARLGDQVVLTNSGHGVREGTVATDPDGTGIRGVYGPAARAASCPYEGHVCAGSDMSYVVVPADRIPWGHLNVVDMGAGGYRVLAPETKPLDCASIANGARVEINGRNVYRSGHVIGQGRYLFAADPQTFPCMVVADIVVTGGDSGGSVLVDGQPAGVVSRSFVDQGQFGFTPLDTGLEELGLTLCTEPDCGLVPPSEGHSSPPATDRAKS